jgi:signal transduction histidine kinase
MKLPDLVRDVLKGYGVALGLAGLALLIRENAIEAMSAVHDRPRELTIVSHTDDLNAVLVEVRDCGSGLESERTEQVFEAFYTTKSEGTGIGLAISRSIVEAHGGRLWAAQNEPHGAVFRFSLPVAEVAAA